VKTFGGQDDNSKTIRVTFMQDIHARHPQAEETKFHYFLYELNAVVQNTFNKIISLLLKTSFPQSLICHQCIFYGPSFLRKSEATIYETGARLSYQSQ
jgi:hypothetical protein